jgi:hypothetical protein
MSERQTATRSEAASYRIRVQGHLAERWSDWFDGLALEHEGDGLTTLSGPVVDQTALHSILARIRDLGLVLILVERLETKGYEHER